MMWAATAFIYAGCIALCLAMPRHLQQLLPDRQLGLWSRQLLRSAGGLLLAAGLFCCAKEQGADVGSVAFFGLLSLVAPCLALLLAYVPSWARVLLALSLLVIVGPLAIA